MRRSTVIVSEHHLVIVGIRSHDCNLPYLGCFYRKNVIVVLEKHYRLSCHLEGMVLMFLRIYIRVWDSAPRNNGSRIEESELEKSAQNAADRYIYILFCNQSLFNSAHKVYIRASALYVGTGKDGSRRCRSGIRMRLMVADYEEVVDGPAV